MKLFPTIIQLCRLDTDDPSAGFYRNLLRWVLLAIAAHQARDERRLQKNLARSIVLLESMSRSRCRLLDDRLPCDREIARLHNQNTENVVSELLCNQNLSWNGHPNWVPYIASATSQGFPFRLSAIVESEAGEDDDEVEARFYAAAGRKGWHTVDAEACCSEQLNDILLDLLSGRGEQLIIRRNGKSEELQLQTFYLHIR